MVVRVDGHLAAQGRSGELTAAIGNHLVDVHVELRPAAGHPDVERKHFVMLPGENLVAHFDDQPVGRLIHPLAGVIRVGRPLFQGGVGGDHLPGDQIFADAEMFERALRLSAPQLVGGNIDLTHAVRFFANFTHRDGFDFS